MSSINNAPEQKTKEHLIPRTLYHSKKAIPPDFYACKQCNNEKKGKSDYIIGWVSKVCSQNDEVAYAAFLDAITNKEHNNSRAVKALNSAILRDDGMVEMTIPLSGLELIDYGLFLTKGQYFADTQKLFNPKKQLIQVSVYNPNAWMEFENQYTGQHNSDYYDDLAQNPHSYSTRDSETVVWRKGNQYMFIFHKFLAIAAEVRPNSCKSRSKVGKAHRKLCKQFSIL
ncbi:hypothetical protein [Maridesulfovibrio sp.]|uniref:hypothetical protein n=1 Tax=Maridesulfovibrio sp. TaxID=2795000 RepID=UPI002AA7D77A|nr:hypothetical protein [Maridesulfovibrio sp.]